jgi:hypothetical protein
MANLAVATRTILAAPGIENVGGQVFLNLHIMNVGEFPLEMMHITGIALDGAPRHSPPGFPLVVGRIGAGGVGHATARFSAAPLAVGSKYLLSVSGHYTVSGVAYGLNLNRYVQIPPVGMAAVPGLRARLLSSTSTNYWDYTLFNDEPPASAQHIVSFSLAVAAPVTVSATPPGWAVDTDSHSFVLWYALDAAPPYPRHVAPGQSLAGFRLMAAGTRSEATPALLSAWDHASDAGGLVFAEYAMTPYRLA